MFSPIFVAGSGRPFNLLLGIDANNDGRSQSDRPFTVGRNTGLGEPFYSFDARLARRFHFKEDMFLELTFEGFNLFNRTNLAGINNVVGALPLDQLRTLASTRARRPPQRRADRAARLHLGRQSTPVAVRGAVQLLARTNRTASGSERVSVTPETLVS